ncbi:mannan endo-1,4-beta-mannosidase 5-like [Canna indica]|uniref:mannan endo-1,4-beta-mannosidase n=1 Tax=Canna indica TaxID=4628 RepID=A0AAQ3Q7V9_9LILI|nr:mannan endo-1,4-beta-mannosidase 5-like [Canna indica]
MAKFGRRKPSFLASLSVAVLLAIAACGSGTAAASPFVQRWGTKFAVDGSTFLFNGFNTYWLMTAASDNLQAKVSQTFSEAAADGLTVCRTWAFSDGGQGALQQSPGVYNENVFRALDFVISEARNHGIRLILSLVNNYKDYGGKSQYVEWARSAGVNIGGEDDFFTNPTLQAWAQEMASFTKSIDNNHLVAVGVEGFYGDTTPDKIQQYNPNGYRFGADFIAIHQIKEIDYVNFHAYPDSWLENQPDAARTDFLWKWIWIHWQDSLKTLGKPLVFGEFGKSMKTPGYSEQMRVALFDIVYNDVYKYAKTGSGSFGGGIVWQLSTEGMDSFGDGYDIVLPQSPATKEVMAQQSRRMRLLAELLH